MKDLSTYITEYITEWVSSGRGRTSYGPTICGKSTFKDICELFMIMIVMTFFAHSRYLHISSCFQPAAR